ncbi:unnamed protein product [Echinostoma caproni]|uniref:Integrin_alpha2 domain-containing protein n=1 Tax=Echinostoma caproni TaxID=27848 RepID=A0A183B0U1_9TREM|nr:unnamed protein product [Echinostoma caproni]
MKAALLSLGAFQLHNGYASVGLLPNKLDRDLLFRRIQLHEPGTYINLQIRIIPGELSLSSPHLLIVELSAWRPKVPLSLSALARAKPPQPSQLLSQPLEPQLPVPEPMITHSDVDLMVQVEREAQDIPIFVCPAGCQSEPIQVSCSKTPHISPAVPIGESDLPGYFNLRCHHTEQKLVPNFEAKFEFILGEYIVRPI